MGVETWAEWRDADVRNLLGGPAWYIMLNVKHSPSPLANRQGQTWNSVKFRHQKMTGHLIREEFKLELKNLDFIQKGNIIPCDLSMHCAFDYWFMVL